ncbi:hypothetical protein IWX75_000008 [Arthrobacter sp. CAN_A6]|uniref:TRAFAC clade GTPase domain-containing protein n=1 Tax=Arthrobacter sp. CAN_A6 TaxID=2787721 RepID=UPI0018CB6F05
MTPEPIEHLDESSAATGHDDTASLYSEDGVVEDVEFDLDAEAETSEALTEDRLQITGGDGLSLSEADEAVGATPSVVVLVAGEANAGKTTLLVELFAQFLDGPVGSWHYAGSRTLRGFDRRHRPARASTGASTATTARTQDDDLRHLHLAIATDERRVDLIISDIRGEVFEAIIDGRSARHELPFLPRVDYCLVLLDGEQMNARSIRDLQMLRGQQLLDGLLEPDSLRDDSSVMLVVTKIDTLDDEARSEAEAGLSELVALIQGRTVSSSVHAISARPEDGSAPVGLSELLDYLTHDEGKPAVPRTESALTHGRYYWRGSW